MATASSLILDGLVMIGDKTIGGTLTTAEETYHLRRLNSMLDSWSLERLMCYQIVQESLALTASTGSYTIGSGGAFNTTRPTRIVDPCFIRDSNNIDYRVDLINADAYGRITAKTIDGGIPRYLFYDTAFVTSLGTIFLWPEPQASLTLYINSPKQITQFALISDTMVLPPGYELAISSNYGIFAAAGFKPISAELAKVAKESKAAIKGVNIPEGILRMDPGLIGHSRYDIRTDT